MKENTHTHFRPRLLLENDIKASRNIWNSYIIQMPEPCKPNSWHFCQVSKSWEKEGQKPSAWSSGTAGPQTHTHTRETSHWGIYGQLGGHQKPHIKSQDLHAGTRSYKTNWVHLSEETPPHLNLLMLWIATTEPWDCFEFRILLNLIFKSALIYLVFPPT